MLKLIKNKSPRNKRRTSCVMGMAPTVLAPLNMSGHASVSFQTPYAVSPTIWPILNAPALPLDFCKIFSTTHLERAYPVRTALCVSSSAANVSGILVNGDAWRQEMEEENRKDAPLERARLRRWTAPPMCCLYEESERLKLTGHAF